MTDFTKYKNVSLSKENAIAYAKKNHIDYDLKNDQKRKIVKKSYADNFIK